MSDEAGAHGDPEWRERELGRVIDIKEMTTAAWNEALRASRAETAEARLAAALLVSERDDLLLALRHLAEPNWGARPTGQDAIEMARYARAQLPSESQARAGSDGLSHGTDTPPVQT